MLQAGIVGLPNVGKSTLFNAVTRSRKAEAANYPFCTIDPNVGMVEVPDERLAVLAEMSKSERVVPAAIEFVDIAGLVKGQPKAPVWATNSSPTSARQMPSCRWCAALRMMISSTSSALWTRCEISKSSMPNSS